MREAIVNFKTGEDSKFFFNTFSQYIDKFVFVIDGGCEVVVPIKLIDGLGVSE
ncbi:hypothetical protein [Escherichia phage vB_EcoD_SU57]|uniref:Uncharacterized protein n=1 Tax=Escherichia phage vB_EcoD_SU57 TaxID=2743969 RepID=A0A7D5JU93_9CAUD|nr:hypothetical protein [Escherichia phage vB_EcoD_SU57]